jgi:hypothetical protein
MKCRPCNGTGVGRNAHGNCILCGGRGTLPDDPSLIEKCNRCNGTGIGSNNVGLCQVCKGYGLLRPHSPVPDPNAFNVFCIEAGKPRTAHLGLAELFKDVTGEIRICDPYYGIGTLLRLDSLKHCSPIKFLSKQCDKSEAQLLPRALKEWQRQHGDVEFRENVGTDLHDRFILSDSELILLGHGLKDVGNKDSFVVRIPSSLAGDMLKSVRNSFDAKWTSAAPII